MQKVTETKKEVVEKTIERFCDDCNTKLARGLQCGVARCELCKADLCNNCVGHENHTTGDYREVYCKMCWELGAPFREKIGQLEDDIEKLEERWKTAGILAREDLKW